MLQQSSAPKKSIFILILTVNGGSTNRGSVKWQEADKQAVLRAQAWQTSEPHESHYSSEACLHLGIQIRSHPPLFSAPSLHLLIAFLHLSIPLIKTLNWLIHTCSCSCSFGRSLHHQSRFSHQLQVHSSAHCPSLTYRAKQ